MSVVGRSGASLKVNILEFVHTYTMENASSWVSLLSVGDRFSSEEGYFKCTPDIQSVRVLFWDSLLDNPCNVMDYAVS